MSLRTKWLLLGGLMFFALWVSAANFVPEEQRRASPLWLDDVMRLGLDLQGGIHIVIGPDLDAAIRQELGAQAARFRAVFGRRPSHVDSHHHLHRFAPVLEVVLDLAASLGGDLMTLLAAVAWGVVRRRAWACW